MRILFLTALLAVLSLPLAARDVSFQRLESDLGDELGFWVFRAETEIDGDEVFVVLETVTEPDGETHRFVNWWVSRGPKPRFSVTLVDASMFAPGSTHFLLRHGGNRRTIEHAILRESGRSPDGLYLKFGDRLSNRPGTHFDWKATVLTRAEFQRQHPERKLPELPRGSTSGGVFVLREDRP